MRHAVLVLLLGIVTDAGAAAADGTGRTEFRLVKQTKYARYYAGAKAKVDVRKTEAFLERLFALFGPAPQGWRLEYYRHESVEDLSSTIGFAAYGVTNLASSRIDSAFPYHPHELVHAVAGRLGRPPLLFTEGLAVALTAKGFWRGQRQDEVARRYLARRGTIYPLIVDFGSEDAERDYAVAGSFVSYLLDRSGIEALVAFFASCGNDACRYARALRDAYGVGLAELEQGWSHWLARDRTEMDWYDEGSWPRALRSRTAAGADGKVLMASLEAAPSGLRPALEYAAPWPGSGSAVVAEDRQENEDD